VKLGGNSSLVGYRLEVNEGNRTVVLGLFSCIPWVERPGTSNRCKHKSCSWQGRAVPF
jgi:hypothetical protein